MIIYKTINVITGKIYIGKDKNNNPNYIGSGKKLKDAIKSYGKHNFKKEILEYCNSYKQLNEREIYWIEQYKSYNSEIGYNMTKGGDGGDIFTNHPDKESYRKKLSVSNTRVQERQDLKNLHKENTTNLWKNQDYRNKVLEGQKKIFSTTEYIESLSNKIKNILKDPKKREIWSNCKKGKLSHRWIGYAYIYNTSGELFKKFETISEARNILSIRSCDMEKIRKGSRDIYITSRNHKSKNPYEGFRVIISKEDFS